MGATTRERLEKAIADTESFASEIEAKEAPSAEDLEKLTGMSKSVSDLLTEIQSKATADGAINLAKGFLGDEGGNVANERDPGTLEVGANGLVTPKGGMTLGECFAKSPIFEEFVQQFKGSDGAIRDVQGLQSKAFEVPGGNFHEKTLITGLSDTSAGALVQPFRYTPITDLIGDRELTIRDVCTVIPIESDTFEYVRITSKTNNAAPVLEATTAADIDADDDPVSAVAGGRKPESALALAVVNSIVENIAHMLPVTRRAAADGGQIRALMDAFGVQGLREEEEDQFLNGSGSTPNLQGVYGVVGNTTGSAGTDLDAVVQAINLIRADRRRPTTLVVHPNDWYSTGFLLAKDTAGNYLVGDPRASIDQLNTLWGLKVVVTEAATENTLLVGDFRQAVIADRQQATVYVTDSHKDWFQRNLLAVLFEERVGFGVLDPDAFCTVTAV